MTKVAILQSNYIPWRGYFDLIRQVDHFVLYDTVQYTKNDWRNRNRVIGANGPVWLTIPVLTSGQFGQSISDTRISDSNWVKRHLGILQASLGRSERYRTYLKPRLSEWYGAVSEMHSISAVNRSFIEKVMQELEIDTTLHDAADLPQEGDRTGRLVSMCRELGATSYLSGPSAQDYLDEAQFQSESIKVEWMNYPDYPTYIQSNQTYEPGVSILDVLAALPPEKVFQS